MYFFLGGGGKVTVSDRNWVNYTKRHTLVLAVSASRQTFMVDGAEYAVAVCLACVACVVFDILNFTGQEKKQRAVIWSFSKCAKTLVMSSHPVSKGRRGMKLIQVNASWTARMP